MSFKRMNLLVDARVADGLLVDARVADGLLVDARVAEGLTMFLGVTRMAQLRG